METTTTDQLETYTKFQYQLVDISDRLDALLSNPVFTDSIERTTEQAMNEFIDLMDILLLRFESKVQSAHVNDMHIFLNEITKANHN